ncbi:MAG TPA: hypothetical protein V6D17_13480 [Candidatus Obscuribacterales bacterium]
MEHAKDVQSIEIISPDEPASGECLPAAEQADEGQAQELAERLREILTSGNGGGADQQVQFAGSHSMQLHLKAGSVDVELNTNTESGAEIQALRSQLQFANELIAQLMAKLDESNRRNGRLEARLALCQSLLQGNHKAGKEIAGLITSDE